MSDTKNFGGAYKLYRQYVGISEFYKSPTRKKPEPVQYQPPSPEDPLTKNKIRI